MDTFENMYKTICRLCLSQNDSENLVPLIDNSTDDGLSNFGKAVTKICNILIQKDDKLPSVMCQKCVYFLKQAIYFKLKCESVDKQLRSIFKINVNSESLDLDIAKTVCEYIMYKHYFPSKPNSRNINNIKRTKNAVRTTKYSSKIDLPTPTENGETNTDLADKTYEFDDFIDNEDIHDHSIVKQEHYSNDVDNLLDSIQDLINAEANTIPYKSRLKRRLKRQQRYLSSVQHNGNEKLENAIHRPKNYSTAIKNERNLTCNICHKTLANRNTYNCHMQRHTNFRYICDQCGKGFPVLCQMRMHQITKHGVGPYLKCDHCPYKAPRKLNLIEHLRLHTGERPFTCEKCGLTFRRKAIWKAHLVCHMEKTVECLHCPRKFFRQSSMLSHCNNVHERLFVYMCSVCNITYTKNETVRRHMLVKHGIPRDKQGKILRVRNNTEFSEKI